MMAVVTSSHRSPTGRRFRCCRSPAPGLRMPVLCCPSRRNRPIKNSTGNALPAAVVDPPPTPSPSASSRAPPRRQIAIDGHRPRRTPRLPSLEAFGRRPSAPVDRPRPAGIRNPTHSSSSLSADAIGCGWSGEPLGTKRPIPGIEPAACIAFSNLLRCENSPGSWSQELEQVRSSSQRCGSTMTVPTLPPRSTSLWAAAVSYSGKRAATDRIWPGDAVQAAMSDCARRRSGCGTPASDIE